MEPPRLQPVDEPDCASRMCRRLVVATSGERPDIAAEAQRLLPRVAEHAQVELVDLAEGRDLAQMEFDVAVVLGGDGSILRAAHQMARHQRPVIGVNLGKLGFLADFSPAEFISLLPSICSGKLAVVEHLMYECQLLRDGRLLQKRLGLNEVAVLPGRRSRSSRCNSTLTRNW